MSLISFTRFSDKMPCKAALNRCSKQITMLADLYKAIGEKTSFKRYGKCWDYFPSDLKERELFEIISTLRRHLNKHEAAISLTVKSLNSVFFYENISRQQLTKMLHCAYALRQDLRYVKWCGSNQREGKNGC